MNGNSSIFSRIRNYFKQPTTLGRWLPLVLIAVLLRMYLVGHDGIVPMLADSTNYATSATHFFSDNSFSRLPAQRPGLALLAWTAAQFGIPFKLMMDGLITVVAIGAGRTVEKLTASFATAALAFLAILFNPWFIGSSQRFMTESLVGLLLLAIVLSFVPLLLAPQTRRSRSLLLMAGVVSSIFLLARNETPLLICFQAMVALVILIRHWKLPADQFSWRTVGARLALSLLPLVMALGSVQVLKAWHGYRYKAAAACTTERPGFKALINALYSIPPEQEIRYAPVTLQSLSAACDVSPALNRHRSRLLDLNRSTFKSAANSLGLENEFGTWLNWHLIGGIRSMDRDADLEMMDAAKEIKAAQADGRLKRRWGKFPISPLWRQWLPDLPRTVGQALVRSVYDQKINVWHDVGQMKIQSSVDQSLFDDGLLRRSGVGTPQNLRIFGSTSSKPVRATAVLVETLDGEPVVTVPVHQGKNGQPFFSVVLDHLENPQTDKEFQLRLIDGASKGREMSSAVQIKDAQRMWWRKFIWQSETDSSKSITEGWTISSLRQRPQAGPSTWLKQQLVDKYQWLVLSMLAVALVTGYRRSHEVTLRQNLGWVFIVAAGFLLGRCVFYSLIEVWLKWSLPRYVDPNVLLSIFVGVCGLFLVGTIIGRVVKRSR